MRKGYALAVVAMMYASTGHALPPLKDNERVRAEFLAAAVGDEIRKHCPTISARMVRVLQRTNQLKSYALGLGYSRDEIRDLRENPTARAELRQLRDAYLARNGVTKGNADSYCRLGYDEIEKKTLTGWLLRAN